MSEYSRGFPHKIFNFLLDKIISMLSNNIDTPINALVNKTGHHEDKFMMLLISLKSIQILK